MTEFNTLENFSDAVCAVSKNNEIVFRNANFIQFFSGINTTEKLKKHFNFNICMLSSDNIADSTPIDFVLKSAQPFHTICSYQNNNEEYKYIYIYTFKYSDYKAIVFKDITAQQTLNTERLRYEELSNKYENEHQERNKLEKLQENAQSQVLKMAVINKISLLIRETNNIDKILSSTIEEINNLLGSYKTFFATGENDSYNIKYINIANETNEKNKIITFEGNVLQGIKDKEITASACLKEYNEANEILQRGITRIIIPVHSNNKMLGIIATYTKHRFSLEENKEVLQSIAVQLASSIIQSELINQLNNKNKDLENTLTELKETQLQLINTEKMASVGQLVSGVAHEINTPLASISSNNMLINKILSNNNLNDSHIEVLKELNSIDIEAANRISDIVKSLKKFVRLDEAEFQQADINNEIDLTLKLTAHEIKNNIKIIKNYGDIPPVMCSINMLNQVFMNLIVNACHSINESKKDGEITISTSSDDKNLTVKIKDNGTGINKDNYNKIFNVGFTTKPKGIGTGLGLSISQKIIELHKGTISFTSEEGNGSEFTIVIPINK